MKRDTEETIVADPMGMIWEISGTKDTGHTKAAEEYLCGGLRMLWRNSRFRNTFVEEYGCYGGIVGFGD